MSRWSFTRKPFPAIPSGSLGPNATLAAVAVAGSVPLLLIAALAPAGVVLPVFAVEAFVVAAVAAAVARLTSTPWGAPRVSLWDVCGAFTFIGCAAAMVSEPENLLKLFGPATGQ
jgi:hypothetical protein